MFCVLFEVHPRPERVDAYLDLAQRLRPDLERIDGFVDVVRYRSLRRDGWILSLSTWRDEKALVRWRVESRHHRAQEQGRTEVFLDYHLRIGAVAQDTRVPAGQVLSEDRLDTTEVGAATAIVLVDTTRNDPATNAAGLVTSDLFEAILAPGNFLLMATFRDDAHAASFEAVAAPEARARVRRVRVIRDYGMFDRREAPQHYPEATRQG